METGHPTLKIQNIKILAQEPTLLFQTQISMRTPFFTGECRPFFILEFPKIKFLNPLSNMERIIPECELGHL